jgi:hypothetical protein
MYVLAERGIKAEWVRRVLAHPERTDVDARDPMRKHVVGKVAGFGGRWLRVVHVETTEEIRIITAFFDRRLEKRP